MSSRATLAVVAAASVALAIGALGTSAARPAASPVASGTVQLAAHVAGRIAPLPVTARPAIAAAASTTTTAKGRRAGAAVVRIRRYADAPGSQRAIDACRLVLWTLRPLWLAGHNYCGFQWLARVRVGTIVRVTSGRAAGRYVVTGHRRLARQSGALPAVRADLVLQTCVGRGTGLTLTRRLT